MANTIAVVVAGATLRITVTLDEPSSLLRARIQIRHSRGSYDVRGWKAKIGGIASAYYVQDHEAPLNEPLVVVLSVAGLPDIVLDPVVIPSKLPILSDPLRGNHMPVIIQSWPEMAYERSGKVVSVVDSRYPVIIEGFELAPSSTIKIIHTQEGTAEELEAVLRDLSVLRIRPSCPQIPAQWASARSRRRARFSNREDSVWVDTIDLLHTSMPSPQRESIWDSLQDLHAAVPGTLGDIHTRWPGTLGDIAQEKLSA